MEEKGTEAWDFLSHHPGRFAEFTGRRIVYVWTGLWGFNQGWGLDESGLPHALLYTGLSVLALLGLRRGIRCRNSYIVPLAILPMFFPAVYYLTHADVRYRHPIDPVIVILAAYGASRRLEKHEQESAVV